MPVADFSSRHLVAFEAVAGPASCLKFSRGRLGTQDRGPTFAFFTRGWGGAWYKGGV